MGQEDLPIRVPTNAGSATDREFLTAQLGMVVPSSTAMDLENITLFQLLAVKIVVLQTV